MKKLLLVLFLTGCAAEAANKFPETGNVHAENQFKWYRSKYYPVCVNHCKVFTGSHECSDRCEKDFQQIKKMLIKAIKENKEDDFEEMMESWYDHE